MAVKFTKPEINVREKLAELDKPSGIAGEAMLRAETAAEQQALIGVGRRNLLINGDFQVWQRGTSFSSGFTADRWYTAAGTVTKDGLAIKHVATNTDPYLLYKVEDLGNKFDGQDAIASFYLKTSSGINKLQYLTVCNVNYTHDVIYELPSEISGYTRWACPVKITDAHTDYIRIVFELEAVSGNISYLRQVQLELGKVATPFEHRSYGEELALCQRYYQELTVPTSLGMRPAIEGFIMDIYGKPTMSIGYITLLLRCVQGPHLSYPLLQDQWELEYSSGSYSYSIDFSITIF